MIKSIRIPEPCSQQWQVMSPVNGGRHCENCSKTVVDFTAMADMEIISHFAVKNNVCGRLSEPQLNRVNLQLTRQDTKTECDWKKWVMTTALLGSTVLYRAAGQTINPSLPGSYHASVTKGKYAVVKGSARVIKGRIVDDDCMPLPGATVRIVGTSIVFASDTNGRFKFHLPKAATEFTVSYIGFETKTVDIDSLQSGTSDFKMKPQVISINDVMVIRGYQVQRRTDVVGAITVVTSMKTTKTHSWLWRIYYKYIRTPIHNIFY